MSKTASQKKNAVAAINNALRGGAQTPEQLRERMEMAVAFDMNAPVANCARMNAGSSGMRISFLERMPNGESYGRAAVYMDIRNLHAFYRGLKDFFEKVEAAEKKAKDEAEGRGSDTASSNDNGSAPAEEKDPSYANPANEAKDGVEKQLQA